ncbi:MAG TPA: copper resistance CopC family protein [Micropepsaceae bacterium]|nr:copper resistance CopC family protein [Micropepsaceae bacterium]
MGKIATIGMLLSALAMPAFAAPAASPQLTGSDPAPNAVVKAPVYMVHMMFDLPVDLKSVSFRVTDRNGKPVDVGQPMPMDAENKMLMAIPNTPLPPGVYKVEWHATGADGKPISGEFSFTAQ